VDGPDGASECSTIHSRSRMPLTSLSFHILLLASYPLDFFFAIAKRSSVVIFAFLMVPFLYALGISAHA
jgi:hypothetical protein